MEKSLIGVKSVCFTMLKFENRGENWGESVKYVCKRAMIYLQECLEFLKMYFLELRVY